MLGRAEGTAGHLPAIGHPAAPEHAAQGCSVSRRAFLAARATMGAVSARTFSLGKAELVACSTVATAKNKLPLWMGLTQGQAGIIHGKRELFFGAQGAAGMDDGVQAEKAGTEVCSERWAQPCSSPWHTWPPGCRAGWLCLATWPASQGKTSLLTLFLSGFSHLPPPLGSASQRWVDGRLSGAAASLTASPACLTKPAQGMLPFWAEHLCSGHNLEVNALFFQGFFRASSVLSPQQDHRRSW